MTAIILEMRQASKERKFYDKALHPSKSKTRAKKKGARKRSKASVEHARLIEAIGALTVEIKVLSATLAKPRKSRAVIAAETFRNYSGPRQ